MKNLVLIITGSVAAIKSIALYKLLSKEYSIRIVATKSAKAMFLNSADATLDNIMVEEKFNTPYKTGQPIVHIELAKWADGIVVYPASANFIGKLANGLCNDLATLVMMVNNKPKLIHPAMNCHMYANPILQKNLNVLKSVGMTIIEPVVGELACGEFGQGRAEEPNQMLKIINEWSKVL